MLAKRSVPWITSRRIVDEVEGFVEAAFQDALASGDPLAPIQIKDLTGYAYESARDAWWLLATIRSPGLAALARGERAAQGRPVLKARAAAQAEGKKTYLGKTCPRCDTDERYTIGGGCVHCLRETSRAAPRLHKLTVDTATA